MIRIAENINGRRLLLFSRMHRLPLAVSVLQIAGATRTLLIFTLNPQKKPLAGKSTRISAITRRSTSRIPFVHQYVLESPYMKP
jgi:hypothetical protein